MVRWTGKGSKEDIPTRDEVCLTASFSIPELSLFCKHFTLLGPEKYYLYEIISNKITGVDVDKVINMKA